MWWWIILQFYDERRGSKIADEDVQYRELIVAPVVLCMFSPALVCLTSAKLLDQYGDAYKIIFITLFPRIT